MITRGMMSNNTDEKQIDELIALIDTDLKYYYDNIPEILKMGVI